MPDSKQSDLQILKRLFAQARPFWWHLGCIFSLSLLSAPIAVLAPLPLKIAVDTIIGSHPISSLLEGVLPGSILSSKSALLIFSAGLVILIGLLNHLQGLGSWLLQTSTGERLLLNFRTQLFRNVQRLSLSYHDTQGTTDSIYRIQYDAPAIQWVVINGVTPFVGAIFTLLGMIYITARIDWMIAVVALSVTPVLYLLTRTSSKLLRKRWYEVKQNETSAMSVVQEVLTAVRVVKAFGGEDREQARFARHANKSMKGQLQLARIEGGFGVLVGVTIAVGTAAVLFIGVNHVLAGVLTLGELLMVMSYLIQLYGPLETLSTKLAAVQSSLASAERAFSLLDMIPEVVESPHAKRLGRAKGTTGFNNVSFAYDNQNLSLRNISFQVESGMSVGIVGTTGAGKTTLVSLLTRFYDPVEGEILLDGVDLRDYRLADLRNQFAVVLQEPVLFSTSIMENIAYARPEASEKEITDAAKAANAHEFIMNLPDGYRTEVGERGNRLSGGERQRLSLARAFLKDAPMLILDEPTSAVDLGTESNIIEAMKRLMQGKTTFIIAHRLSTIKDCDRILKLENGRLVEFTNSNSLSSSSIPVTQDQSTISRS